MNDKNAGIVRVKFRGKLVPLKNQEQYKRELRNDGDNILLHKLFDCRLDLGSTILGVKTFADNKVDLPVASCPSPLKGTFRVGDSFLDV